MSAHFPQPPHDSHLPADLSRCTSPRAPHVPSLCLRPAAPALFSTVWTRQPLCDESLGPRWTRIRPHTRAGSRERMRTSKERQRSQAYTRETVVDTRRRTTSATTATTVVPAARHGAVRSVAGTGSGRPTHARPRTASHSRRGTAAPYRDAKARSAVLLRRLHARAAARTALPRAAAAPARAPRHSLRRTPAVRRRPASSSGFTAATRCAVRIRARSVCSHGELRGAAGSMPARARRSDYHQERLQEVPEDSERRGCRVVRAIRRSATVLCSSYMGVPVACLITLKIMGGRISKTCWCIDGGRKRGRRGNVT
jgi:hypothetical protein